MNVGRAQQVEGMSTMRISSAAADLPLPNRRATTLRVWRVWRRTPLAMVGGVLLLILIVTAVIGPELWPLDPLKQSLLARNQPPGWVDSHGTRFLLGTDPLGRDLVARLLLGLRISLLVGLVSTIGAALIGVSTGILAGYLGGKVDALIMRIVDIQMSFPFILIAIIWALFVGTGTTSIIVIVALRGWVSYTRIIRSRVLAVRELAYIEAAHVQGCSPARILVRHVLPQTTAAIIILTALQIGTAIIFESTLGFLGLGIQPPTPTLGNMLADGRDYLGTAWWIVVFPGCLLSLVVAAVNLFGDGLRDILDPQRTRTK